MNRTKYMVTSGFLGAGKTTSMLAFSRSINNRYAGATAAILANDLGAGNIVDADFTAQSEVLTTSISGNCICYQHENLVDKLHQLIDGGATVIFSDIPGCGIGALDNVYLQILEKEPEEFDLMPFTCIVDPERLKLFLDEKNDLNLPIEMRFLLNAQMAEADLIALNKIDTITDREREERLALIRTLHPDAQVMAMSARTGEGVDEVVDYLLSHSAAAQHREIGYGSEHFMAAEKLMSWYNRRVFFTEKNGNNVDFNSLLTEMFEQVRTALKNKGGNVPHFKVFASGEEGDYFKASLIGVDYPIEYDRKFDKDYTALSVIINARAVTAAQVMDDAVEKALEQIAETYNVRTRTFFLENFDMMEEGRGNGGRASRY